MTVAVNTAAATTDTEETHVTPEGLLRGYVAIPAGHQRARLPHLLITSRHHCHTDLIVYAAMEALRCTQARREWWSARLGISLRTLARSLANLTTSHDLPPDLLPGTMQLGDMQPAWVHAQRRGARLVQRQVQTSNPYAEVSFTWMAGDADNPTTLPVDPGDFRVYAALRLYVRFPDSDPALRPQLDRLARDARVSRNPHRERATPGIVERLDRLEAARIVVTYRQRGGSVWVVPLGAPVDDATHERLRAALAAHAEQAGFRAGPSPVRAHLAALPAPPHLGRHPRGLARDTLADWHVTPSRIGTPKEGRSKGSQLLGTTPATPAGPSDDVDQVAEQPDSVVTAVAAPAVQTADTTRTGHAGGADSVAAPEYQATPYGRRLRWCGDSSCDIATRRMVNRTTGHLTTPCPRCGDTNKYERRS